LSRQIKKCIVGSTVILDKKGLSTLLIKHKKLNVWINPGGHLEGQEFPYDAAAREAMEETGTKVRIISAAGSTIKIKETHARTSALPLHILEEKVVYSDSTHTHLDFIYLSIANKTKTHRVGKEESKEIKWYKMEDMPRNLMFRNSIMVIESAFKSYSSMLASRRSRRDPKSRVSPSPMHNA
jgi:ADP-ribose pyrophosphatase YjhB (NUDIX family)